MVECNLGNLGVHCVSGIFVVYTFSSTVEAGQMIVLVYWK